MRRLLSLRDYLPRTGGWYIIIVIFTAQLLAIPGAILGTLSIQQNASFDPAIMAQTTRYTPLFILTGNIILLVIAWYLTPAARQRLTDWSRDQMRPLPEQEVSAWREITSLTWRYGVIAVVVASIVDILLPSTYYYQHQVTTFDQYMYSNIGGLVSVLGTVIIAVLLIDRLLTPVRLILLPKGFETQLTGLAGPRLTNKFLIMILVLIVISLFMIAPIGFHYMNESLTPGNQYLRQSYQSEAIIMSVLVLILSAALAFFISKTVSDPLKELITILQAVEAGDLTQRVNVTATDEIAEVTMHFNRMITSLQGFQENLEKQVSERTRLLKAANEAAKVASAILDPDELLAKVITLFTDQFNYYFAAIYLVDPGEKWVELKAATGEAGNVLKQNHHRLELSGKGMVVSCIREKAPRITQNTADDKQRVENPLLPYTRSEVALPLIAGDRVLGALNVQSTKIEDFGLEVIETMQSMTGQIAITLENARLFQETQQRIKEMQSIQQQYLREGWRSTSLSQNELEYGIGESYETNTQKITSPINLRDINIGQITVEGTDEWTLEQKNLVDAVATQAAIALENARLVNESRQLAIRERMLAEINSKIWSSNTIDAVLQTAIKELGRRFDASDVTIELKMDDKS